MPTTTTSSEDALAMTLEAISVELRVLQVIEDEKMYYDDMEDAFTETSIQVNYHVMRRSKVQIELMRRKGRG